MNEWSGCSADSLSLIYHSVDVGGFNQPTRELWEWILIEIGEELDRRREGATSGEARWSLEPSFLAEAAGEGGAR